MTNAINTAITEALFKKINENLWAQEYIIPIKDHAFYVNYSIVSNPKFHYDYWAIPLDGTFLYNKNESKKQEELPLIPIYQD